MVSQEIDGINIFAKDVLGSSRLWRYGQIFRAARNLRVFAKIEGSCRVDGVDRTFIPAWLMFRIGYRPEEGSWLLLRGRALLGLGVRLVLYLCVRGGFSPCGVAGAGTWGLVGVAGATGHGMRASRTAPVLASGRG